MEVLLFVLLYLLLVIITFKVHLSWEIEERVFGYYLAHLTSLSLSVLLRKMGACQSSRLAHRLIWRITTWVSDVECFVKHNARSSWVPGAMCDHSMTGRRLCVGLVLETLSGTWVLGSQNCRGSSFCRSSQRRPVSFCGSAQKPKGSH